jgi:hypothetical protein
VRSIRDPSAEEAEQRLFVAKKKRVKRLRRPTHKCRHQPLVGVVVVPALFQLVQVFVLVHVASGIPLP